MMTKLHQLVLEWCQQQGWVDLELVEGVWRAYPSSSAVISVPVPYVDEMVQGIKDIKAALGTSYPIEETVERYLQQHDHITLEDFPRLFPKLSLPEE